MFRARSTRFPRVVLSLAAACAVWVLTTTATFGQSTTATVRGTVEDSSGGVLPGANVTTHQHRHEGGADDRQRRTRAVPPLGLLPRHLRPESRARPGSRPTSRRRSRSARTTSRGIDVRLEVGQQTETVTVTAQSEVIQTETGAREGVLTAEADRQPVDHGTQLARTAAHPSRRGHRLQYRRVDRSCQGRPELYRQRHPIVGQHRAARWIEPPRHRLQLRHDGVVEQRHGSGGEGPELQLRGRIRRRRHERERRHQGGHLVVPRHGLLLHPRFEVRRQRPVELDRGRREAEGDLTSTPASTSAVRSSSATATRRTRTSCSSSSATNGSARRSTRAAASRAPTRRR